MEIKKRERSTIRNAVIQKHVHIERTWKVARSFMVKIRTITIIEKNRPVCELADETATGSFYYTFEFCSSICQEEHPGLMSGVLFLDLFHCFDRISPRGGHLPIRGIQPWPRGADSRGGSK